jgi:glyoxylase-like metal-dependent hydrolase (beta-lactamase superfamily II)
VPTFPHARHIYVDAEIAARRADTSFDARHLHADAIAPIFDAGLADVVEADADLGSGLRLASTPGHTPGHASLWLTSGTDLALVTGDVLHHPVQCAEPALSFVSDDDPATAEATRRATLAAAVDTGAFVLGTHFPTEPGGRVVVDGAAWRFVAERGAPVPAVG